MPDGERVTTGSEPRRWTLGYAFRRKAAVIDGPWLRELESVTVVEIVEPGHDEQTEGRRLLRIALEEGQKVQDRAERLEAELREAREALAFYADEENHAVQIRFAPVTGERYGAPSLVAEDRGDRARGVLEKDTGSPA